MNIRDINPNPHNPRKISGERLKKLEQYLAEYGDLSGIVYNSNPECQALVSGHQRMHVFRKGKGKPVILERYDPPQADGTVARGFIELKSGHRYVYREVHWEKENADAATIIANGQFGEWDSDILTNAFQFDMPELREMGVPEFVFSGVGEIGEGGNTLNREKQEVQEDDYEIPDEIKTDIVPGDLFEIGPHRLLCGDSTSADLWLKILPGDGIEIIYTDPPYSSGGYQESGKTSGSIGARGGKKIETDNLSTRGYISLMDRVLANIPGAHTVFIFCDWKMWAYNLDIAEAKGYRVRNMLVWDKVQMGMGMPFRNQHELCLFGSKLAGKIGDGRTPNVLQFKRDRESEHATPKPVELIAAMLNQVEGKTIADPFLGGGSTMVAAHQLHRRCYGMEIDPKYCQVIVDRMLKLGPTLEIKRNGQPYLKTGN